MAAIKTMIIELKRFIHIIPTFPTYTQVNTHTHTYTPPAGWDANVL